MRSYGHTIPTGVVVWQAGEPECADTLNKRRPLTFGLSERVVDADPSGGPQACQRLGLGAEVEPMDLQQL